jgi:hypothetical protein
MQASRCSLTVFLLIVTTLTGSLVGQQAPTVASSAPVPQLVNYSGKATDVQGKLRASLGFGIFWRITIALVLVAPLGFVLGMPFPLGLRLAMQRSSALGSWAWGVNGFFTVIGTILALMLGMMIGFRMVLLLACGSYVGGLLALSWLSQRESILS